jgi:hypothetical protein
VGEAARMIKKYHRLLWNHFLVARRRSICRSLLSARLDLAESLPVTQIAREVYASESSAILNHARTIEND